MADRSFLLIDRRFNRLCEIGPFPHGETADLFWIDVTDRPDVTLEWTWRDDGTPQGVLSPPEPKADPAPGAEVIDYGVQTYTFDSGAGLPRHRHAFAHDHVVTKGRTIVTIEGQQPVTCVGPCAPLILPANLYHGIMALEDGTTFVNTRIADTA